MELEPIVHEFDLSCSPEHAFDVYTGQMGRWWLPRYTGDPDTFTDVTIDPRLGGQITERHSGGAEHDWGEVIAWEPGVRVAYTSTLAQDRTFPSVVRVFFEPAAAGCHVRFEHGGWDQHNGAERAKFTDWPVLLERYQALAEGRLDETGDEARS